MASPFWRLARAAAGAFRAPPPLPARDAYALWADTYPPRAHNPLMQLEQAIVAPMLASISSVRALDVGTGSGRYLPLLAQTGARLVVGVDFSRPMLARHEHGGPRVCADACRLPFGDATFDLISSSLMVGDVADLSTWVNEAARVLAPGGHLIYSDFHPSWATERWRRTFRAADGRAFDVAYFPHTIAEHLAALDARSFDVRAIREPRLTPPNGIARPGRIRRSDRPVVVVFHAVRRRERQVARPRAGAARS